jgi:hypothetical protein
LLDLPVAMASNAALKTTVTGFFNQANLTTVWTSFDNFLYQWAGTTSLTGTSGSYDTRKLVTIAKFLGFTAPTTIAADKVANLNASWLLLKEKFYTDLIAQTQAGQALSLQYQYDQNTVATKTDTLN